MKKLLLVFFASFVMICAAKAGTANFYVNNGTVTDPINIDATNFVNNGLFSVATVQPYDFTSVRNFTNRNTMLGNVGFRFDTAPAGTGSRFMAANFVNAGLTPTTLTNASIQCSSHLLVSATNIVNRGWMSVQEYGLLSLQGKNVDVSRGVFQAGTFSDPLELTPEGVYDRYWGFGVNTFFPPLNIDVNFQTTPLHSVTEFAGLQFPGYFFLTTSLNFFDLAPPPTVTSAEVITTLATNRTVQLVFVRNPNTNITTTIRTFGNTPFEEGIVEVEWSAVGTNAFNQVVTNSLFLTDTFGVDATNGFFVNYPASPPPPFSVPTSPETFQPDNFLFTRTSFFTGLIPDGGTNPFTSKAPNFWSASPLQPVSAQYSAYAVDVTTTTFSPVGATNIRTWPGRIEMVADRNLDLNLTRIEGLNYLKLNSTNHFSGASNAFISATYADIALGSTNGMLVIKDVLRPAIPRFSGTIDIYSAKWTNGVVFAGSTNPVQFHVLFVDSLLSEASPPQIFDLSLRSTNMVVGDVLNVLTKFSLNGERLTLLTNGAINLDSPNLNWSDGVPSLRTLTNHGSITAQNAIYFVGRNPDGSDKPYESVANYGLIEPAGLNVSAWNFLNQGQIISVFGSIQIDAVTNVTLLPSNILSAPQADVIISCRNFNATNAGLMPGRALVLSVTGNLAAGDNTWTVYDGFSLLSKPATGDFNLTTITNVAFPYANPVSWWAGIDRGSTVAGFSNNAALGKLVLNGGPQGVFTFTGTGPSSNALYVDVLILQNSATNLDVDSNIIALQLDPGMKLYFSQAFIDDGLGGLTDITSTVAGKNGGSLVQLSHAGPLSLPIPATSFSAALKVKVDLAPTPRSLVTWDAVPLATNYLYCVTHPGDTNWQVVTNFVSGPAGGSVTIADPVLHSSRFYKVRVDVPAH